MMKFIKRLFCRHKNLLFDRAEKVKKIKYGTVSIYSRLNYICANCGAESHNDILIGVYNE